MQFWKYSRVMCSQHMVKRYLVMCHAASTGLAFVEKEMLSHYNASQYYPVHLYQTFCSRYTIAVRRGFGASSTVWLCEDLMCVPNTTS